LAEKPKITSNSSIKKVPLTTKLTTICLIALSILSVVSIIFIYTLQVQMKTHEDQADSWAFMINIIESDATELLEADREKHQISLSLHQELLYWNDLIIQMKEYNTTVQPGFYMQSDIDFIMLQLANQIELNNALVKSTYAYNWSVILGLEEWYHWIQNKYGDYLAILDVEVQTVLNLSASPDIPEILLISWEEWRREPLNNVSIELQYGERTAYFADQLGFTHLGEYSLQEIPVLRDYVRIYEENAEKINEVINTMTSALLLMTITAVILAFVVSIQGNKYIWITFIVAIVVAAMSVVMFTLAVNTFMLEIEFINMSGVPV
jgi:hypothetical protein